MNSLSLNGMIAQFSLSGFLPTPKSFYSSARSTFVAAMVGGAYGLVGRVIYPKQGIFPVNYTLWFAGAFQIKECFELFQRHFKVFLGVTDYLEQLEYIPENELDLEDQLRHQIWKIIQLKNHCIKTVDAVFCRIFNLRSYQEVTIRNVYEASFLEMCRYRIWKIFKLTILDTISFSITHRLLNTLGFHIPQYMSVPLLLLIRSIVRDIILVPALYSYARFCNTLVNELGNGDKYAASIQEKFINYLLPEL